MFFAGDEMRAALAARDIATVYRLLGRQGVSQHQIARLTGQSQSEVSEILKGRTVRDVWVLERIADGLEVRRRAVFAETSVADLGQAFLGLGELTELPLPTGEALPSRLDMSHVHIVAAVIERLREVARYFGGQGSLFSTAAAVYTRWMQVPATDAVTAALAAALAELHTEAGWCCHDSGVDGTGHFTRALGLASAAGDSYGIANAALHAGVTWVRSGHPRDAFERASADFVTAAIQVDLGQLDAAAHSATSALRSYSEDHRRGRTLTELLLAEIHVRAGDPQGLTLAHEAIEKVKTLQSVAARRERLVPLATALEARPGTDTRELARLARRVSATQI
ncbi:MAG: helix-turn-helix domain-containing protein [Pseudonocardiaceae bacterium]